MYRKTYFDIDSGYRWGTGYPNDEARQTFKEESRAIFERLGWEIRRAAEGSGSCDIAVKGKQELYLHPMQFSGVILTEDVPDIEAAIRAANGIQLLGTRSLERYEDMSDEACAAFLDEHREEMIGAILSAYTTKRRNLFIASDISERIGEPFRIRRLASKDTSGDMAYERVKQLVEELVTDGRLVTAETRHGRGIRAAVPAESKKAAQKKTERTR